MVYCSTIGQFIYLGEISVLGNFNGVAPRSAEISNVAIK